MRQFTYSEDGGALRIWINGRRFIPRGGNWGFGESMLRYRAREYDAAVRYHRDMNFTMIRNWVGQIGDDAFLRSLRSLRRRGLAGFLAGQSVGRPRSGRQRPVPAQCRTTTCCASAIILQSACMCGRNEGYPPKPIEDGIRRTLAEQRPRIPLHPQLRRRWR